MTIRRSTASKFFQEPLHNQKYVTVKQITCKYCEKGGGTLLKSKVEDDDSYYHKKCHPYLTKE